MVESSANLGTGFDMGSSIPTYNNLFNCLLQNNDFRLVVARLAGRDSCSAEHLFG